MQLFRAVTSRWPGRQQMDFKRGALAGAMITYAVVLQGCGWGLFTSRESDPVIEDYIQTGATGTSELGVLSTTASRRTIMMRLKNSASGKAGVVCAEPPPDVGEAFARVYAVEAAKQASHDVSVGGSSTVKGQVGANAAAMSAASTAIAPLLHRSQGLQLYRDGLHSLCQDLMNNIITDQEYSRRRNELMMVAKELILAELRVIGEWKPGLPSSVAGPSLPVPYGGRTQNSAMNSGTEAKTGPAKETLPTKSATGD